MNIKGYIEIDDFVNINFHGSPYQICNAKVLGIPSATGDSWKVQTENNKLVYVQQFETMWRVDNTQS